MSPRLRRASPLPTQVPVEFRYQRSFYHQPHRLFHFVKFIIQRSPNPTQFSGTRGDINESMGTMRYINSMLLTIVLLEPWGSGNLIGLTGLEVVSLNNQVIALTSAQISVFPPELMTGGLAGSVDALIDGVNRTTELDHMWLVSNDLEGKHPTIQIRFPVVTPICGIRIYNYNNGTLETFYGAKFIQIFCYGYIIGVQKRNELNVLEFKSISSERSGCVIL